MPPIGDRVRGDGEGGRGQGGDRGVPKNDPDCSIDKPRLNFEGKYSDPDDLEKLVDDLRIAGLPE